ncbi:MAG TPA: helix-turn-helix transcriptional regulator [Pararhizobium sp.]|nr:helix-turn-helix transcriptional regulator [Pararhizobium sp.]
MIARDAILSQLDEVMHAGDVARGMDLVCAYAGAERYLVARCEGFGEAALAHVVTSNWPFDLVRSLGIGIIREQAKVSEIERCLTTLQPVFNLCPADVDLPEGLGRRYCLVPFNAGPARMVMALLFRDGIVLSQERLGDAALMAAYLVDGPPDLGRPNERPLDLTEREIECLAWISEGKTSDEISMIIGISRNTVNNYITSIMRKTATRTRSEAIALAVRSRLI